MKNLFKFSLLTLCVTLMFTACEDDPGGGGSTINDPSLLLSSETGFVSFEETVDANGTFAVRLIGEKGDADLQAITVREAGSAIDVSRLKINGNIANANPFLLVGDETSSFSIDLEITAQSVSGTSTYSFELRDLDGRTANESVVITVNSQGPSLELNGGSGMFSADLGALVAVPIKATIGSSELLDIAVYSEGDLVNPEDLYYDDVASSNQFSVNPIELPDADFPGFERTIYIRARKAGTHNYQIQVIDMAGLTAELDFTINSGTPVMMREGVLLNQGGPTGTGGLDLDTGDSTGSSDIEAEIKDEGIDQSLPDADNWIRRISGANGTEVKHLFANQMGLSENFNFNDIETSEQIAGIWDNGIAFSDMNGNNELISLRVEIGDTFIALRDNKYYLFVVRDIVETSADNADNYMLDVKF